MEHTACQRRLWQAGVGAEGEGKGKGQVSWREGRRGEGAYLMVSIVMEVTFVSIGFEEVGFEGFRVDGRCGLNEAVC